MRPKPESEWSTVESGNYSKHWWMCALVRFLSAQRQSSQHCSIKYESLGRLLSEKGMNDVEKNDEQREEPKQPGGITGRGFLPAQSGNPNGRPRTRGLVNALRAKVAEAGPDGLSLEDRLVGVLVVQHHHQVEARAGGRLDALDHAAVSGADRRVGSRPSARHVALERGIVARWESRARTRALDRIFRARCDSATPGRSNALSGAS